MLHTVRYTYSTGHTQRGRREAYTGVNHLHREVGRHIPLLYTSQDHRVRYTLLYTSQDHRVRYTRVKASQDHRGGIPGLIDSQDHRVRYTLKDGAPEGSLDPFHCWSITPAPAPITQE